jgi:hypothetical protein
VVVTVMKELLDKVVRENTVLLPAEGTSIEVQWTDQDENYLKWFTAVVVKRNVPRKQARQEKHLEWRAKCHQIQYTMPPNEIEWVLLEWAERPAKPRRARVVVHPLPPRTAAGAGPRRRPLRRRSRGATNNVIM